MKTDYDVVVIGAGVIGTMTAKALAERGRQTLILERYQLGNKHGSSHGLNRIVRVTDYHPDYVRINRLAMRGWEELQEAAGETLLVRTGNLEIGEGARIYADALEAAGERYEWLSPEEARERWPRSDSVRMNGCSSRRTAACVWRIGPSAPPPAWPRRPEPNCVRARGSSVSNHDTFAEVVIEGETIRAPVVVVTAGAWAGKLLAGAGLDLPLVPTLEQVSYYKLDDPSPLPTIIDYTVDGAIDHYAVPHPTREGELQARPGSRRAGRRPRHAVVRAGPGTPCAGGDLGTEPFPIADPDGATRDLSVHEHARQRLRPGSRRVGRRRLGVQRARLQGEPDGRNDPGRPGDRSSSGVPLGRFLASRPALRP